MSAADRPPGSTPPEEISVLLVGVSDGDLPLSAAAPDDGRVLVTEAARGRDALQWLTAQPGRVDCVVCASDLPDVTAIGLLESVRASDPDLPFVLLAADGSEATASRAITAGVSEYVAVDDGPSSVDLDDLYERVQRVVTDARSSRALRRRARQFDALLDDDERYVWVLDPDGRVRLASPAARDCTGRPDAGDADEPFWERAWWTDAADSRSRIRSAVRTAREGEVARFEARLPTGQAQSAAVDLTVRPVRGRTGAVESVLVEGVDVSERTELERELRESEELHRVTLNNMTDTVLVTDDDGAFTYICPNVHFIFGYSVEEIREMGSIAELLGDDLFDPDRLAAEGVLTNIETTATDEAGREHTLLVNVREVSIQGGTLLYSCRDVTKRKERERALTALHRTSRELLYAETPREIAGQIEADAVDVLDLPGSAVYLFENDENVLRPVACSDELQRMHGPLSTIAPQEASVVGHAFVEQTAATYGDVHDSDRLRDPATDVRSAIVIPLGDHGVFVVASGEVDAFDEITEEIVDLLAANAEAALDRVGRESELRARDRELQRQNRQLTRLNRTNEIIRDIDKSLVESRSREEIEQAVCDRLTAEDRFELAWIGSVTDGTLRPRAWSGESRGYFDAVDLGTDDATEPAVRTASSLDPTVVVNVGEDLQAGGWRKAALSRGFQSVASVPLVHDGFSFGVLTVYASQPDVFDEMARAVLTELGGTIASAIRSAERNAALVSDTVTELEYRLADSQCVLYALAEAAGCSLRLKGGMRSSREGTQLLVAVEDAVLDDVIRVAREMVAVADVRAIVTAERDGLLQLTVSTPFVGSELTERGAMLRTFVAEPEAATATVDVPRTISVQEVDEFLAERYPGSELVAQRDRDRSLMTEKQFRAEVLEALTDRQLEVVQTAFFAGYFDSPRHNSGEEVAELLDISSSAFYAHVRTVQSKLFSKLFERTEPLSTP